ncbi:hypothetical protein [Prochlorococcus sp. MIT 1300]|uniref:hypothetical protein n=1 Tax=Prochlorococcus sp. MIT 1300 TaxID=3096218 RepID=UPI002A75F867|nr:hypothetical protein [Prochlorococcus sp. MIT 1300]
MFNLIGYIVYLVALVDFLGMFLGYDITGFSWSPVVFCGLAAGCQSEQMEKFEGSKLKTNKKELPTLWNDFLKSLKRKDLRSISSSISVIISLIMVYRLLFIGDEFYYTKIDLINIIFLSLITRETLKIRKDNYVPLVLVLFSIVINLWIYSL